MELDSIKLQTTWNDAAGTINANFLKVLQAIAAIEAGGAMPDLSGYATKEDVDEALRALVGDAPEALDTLQDIAAVLEGNVDSIEDLLEAIGLKASREELAVVAGLVNEHTTKIDSLEGKDAEHDASIVNHEGRIQTLETNDTDKETRLSTLEGDVEEQGDAIADLDGRVATLEEKDDMFRWVTDADGTKRIETDYDFASMRTVASGGVGEQGEILGGGIQAVQVNGVLYDDANEDGVIELPDLATKRELVDYLPLSGGTITGQLDVANINGYTPITQGNIGGYALKIDGSNEMQGNLSMGSNRILFTITAGDNRGQLGARNNDIRWYNGTEWNVLGYKSDIDKVLAIAESALAKDSFDRIYADAIDSDVVSATTMYADTFTGNATSATKLQTARTIWGRSFDGTGNISGAIEGATTGSFSSNVIIGGTLSVTQAVALSSTLSVAGTSTFTGKTIHNGGLEATTGSFSSTLRVAGLLTASGGAYIPSGESLTIGGAVLSWDAAASALQITTSVYSNGTVSALGVGEEGGSSGGDTYWTIANDGALVPSVDNISVNRIQGIYNSEDAEYSSLYIGDANNTSYVFTADIASQLGTDYWVIEQLGTAKFKKITAASGTLTITSPTITGATITGSTYNGYTLGSACAKSYTSSVTSGSSALVTSGAVYTAIQNAGGGGSGDTYWSIADDGSLAPVVNNISVNRIQGIYNSEDEEYYSLYIGDAENLGYVLTADIASQSGTNFWVIEQSGTAKFRGISAPPSQTLTITNPIITGATISNATYNGYTLGAACAKSVTTSVTSGSTALVTSGAVYTAIQNAGGGGGSVTNINGSKILRCESLEEVITYLESESNDMGGYFIVNVSANVNLGNYIANLTSVASLQSGVVIEFVKMNACNIAVPSFSTSGIRVIGTSFSSPTMTGGTINGSATITFSSLAGFRMVYNGSVWNINL